VAISGCNVNTLAAAGMDDEQRKKPKAEVLGKREKLICETAA
jgi:hypothetical protein